MADEEKTEKDPEPIISTDLPTGESLRFFTKEEVTEFVNREWEYWEWLRDLTNNRKHPDIDGNDRNSINQVWNIINGPLNNLRQQVTNDQMPQAQNTLRELYSVHGVPISTSPAGQFLDQMKDRDLAAAGIATGYFYTKGPQPPNPTKTAWKAYLDAHLFTREIDQTGIPEIESLRETQAEWSGQLDQARADKAAFAEDAEGIKSTRDQELAGLLKEKREALDTMLADGKEQLENITKTYDQELSLQAPVAYWKKAKFWHGITSACYGLASLASAGFGGWFLFYFGNLLFFHGKLLVEPADGEAAVTASATPAEIALFVVIATFVVWITRILVRLLLSEVHMKSVAGERVVMANTYLSLSREGGNLQEEDKKLILNALFRPATTGLVKEDGIPAGAYDLLTKIGKP